MSHERKICNVEIGTFQQHLERRGGEATITNWIWGRRGVRGERARGRSKYAPGAKSIRAKGLTR